MASSHFVVQDISVHVGERQILDHISFSIDEPGHVIGLLGPNGSGKTMLLRSLCGEVPHAGHVLLDGTSLSGLRSKELAGLVSYIPQQSGISISMSVMDVVLMGFYSRLKLLSQPSADMRTAARAALERVGISHLSDRDYLTLSGGEKQLVILARTLVEDTKLLLFDEPDSSLDLGNKYRMLKLIAQIGKTSLICLHDPTLALTYCDTLLLLKDGRLTFILHPSIDPVPSMEQAFSELYGPVKLVELPEPQDSEHRRLILVPVL